MEGAKWGELKMDCLANVFGRLGMESLLFDVPFVCKSWYKATLCPLCWQHLEFPKFRDSFKSRIVDGFHSGEFNGVEFIKFVVNRSGGAAVSLVLPTYCTEEALVYVAERCPSLKYLSLPNLFIDVMLIFPMLISKLKNLERLSLGNGYQMECILTQVNLHCKDFVHLGISRAYMNDDETLFIVNLLPNLKYLDIRLSYLPRENLVMILKSCKKLVHFVVDECVGCEDDDEILNLSSHIPNFKCQFSFIPEESMSYDEFFWCYCI